MKILIIQNRIGIGDMIIFLPFVEAISKKFGVPVSCLLKKNTKADQILKNNKFIKDQNYSTSHLVKDGESLSVILKKYYGNSGLNMRIVELSIIEINKHAFVRNNPNYLFSGKRLAIPSVNQIMNLVKNKPDKKTSFDNKKNHIYFYGN